MNKPHKHKDLIVAWANGSAIQYYCTQRTWVDSPNPTWGESTIYRIKPLEDGMYPVIYRNYNTVLHVVDGLYEIEGHTVVPDNADITFIGSRLSEALWEDIEFYVDGEQVMSERHALGSIVDCPEGYIEARGNGYTLTLNHRTLEWE